MKIGILKEIKGDDRVAIVPHDIRKLINQKIEVTIQAGAGQKAGFSDLDYSAVGAKVVKGNRKVFANSTLIVKAGIPTLNEIKLAQKFKCALSGNMYLSFHSKQLYQLIKRKITSIAFESYILNDEYVIAKPIEVSKGQLIAHLCAIQATRFSKNGLGKTLSPLSSKENKFQITILNDSIAAREIARIFLAFGANVTILETRESNAESIRNDQKLKALKEINNCTLIVKSAKFSEIENTISKSDIFIYTPLSPDANANQTITEKMIESMPKGAIIIDLLPMEGFISDKEKPNAITNRQFVLMNKRIRYSNISSLFSSSVSIAISEKISDLILEMNASQCLTTFIKANEPLRNAVQTFEGELTSQKIARNLNIKSVDINNLLK